MHDRLFEAALGIAPPWFVAGVRFDEASKVLTVGTDFTSGICRAMKPASRH
jgi:transposase